MNTGRRVFHTFFATFACSSAVGLLELFDLAEAREEELSMRRAANVSQQRRRRDRGKTLSKVPPGLRLSEGCPRKGKVR